MPRFAYTGRAASGAVSGELDGADAGAVAALLQSRGVTPLQIHAGSGASSGAARASGGDLKLPKWFEPKVQPADLMLFSRQLHTLLRAGVPILRALAGLQESAVNPTMKQTLANVRHSLESGIELSVCFAQQGGVFDNFYIAMVRVGEMTGMLDQIFLRLFDHLEFERETRERVKTALRYPMFVVLAMIGAIAVINLFVIPAFAKVYAGFNAELPIMTRILIASSNFMVHFWPLLLVLAISVVFGFRAYIRTVKGRYQWDKYKLRLPVAGKIMLKSSLARFARSFALASKSGVPIMQALSVVAQVVDNDYIAERVDQMREGIERGDSVLRTAVASGVFTTVVLQMIAVGEETGELDDLMQEIAEMYDREVEYDVKTLSAQLEPILIVGLGILVLILALGIFLPIWDLGRVALHK